MRPAARLLSIEADALGAILDSTPAAAFDEPSPRRFGAPGEPARELHADVETFVRLCGGRRTDPGRYRLTGAVPADLVLFG